MTYWLYIDVRRSIVTYMNAEPIEPEPVGPVPHVRRIGIRELQKNTAAVIRDLTEAEEAAEITSRGEVVARLIPMSPDEVLMRKMIVRGELIPAQVTGGLGRIEPLPPRADGRSLSEALAAMREEERW